MEAIKKVVCLKSASNFGPFDTFFFLRTNFLMWVGGRVGQA